MIDSWRNTCSPLQPASQRWGRLGPTSPRRGCTTFQLKPPELKTLVCHKTCWCDPWNPFLKAAQSTSITPKQIYMCTSNNWWSKFITLLLWRSYSTGVNNLPQGYAFNNSQSFNLTSSSIYLLCKAQSQQSLHSPLYPGAGYLASNLWKLQWEQK